MAVSCHSAVEGAAHAVAGKLPGQAPAVTAPQATLPNEEGTERMLTASGTRLFALCTVAVGAIYAAGYFYTEPAITGTDTAGAVTARSTVTPAKPATPGSGTRPAPVHRPSPPTVTYKDGTYTGFGSNPYGTLSVAVTIAHGRIASVRITSYNMHYPSYFIDPQMNREVVAMQTWRVYVVSGATASSYNFAEAVYQALQKAKV
jgi:uncharacterized protein with FMN-binding domain